MPALGTPSDALGARDPSQGRALLACHANVLVYALAYWLCQPIEPFLTKQLGADRVVFGELQTVANGAQVSAPSRAAPSCT